ncbi:hypothetical protein [Halanaerobaculum tunisiense]
MPIKERKEGEEQPYIPFGPFKIRMPIIHYDWAWPEFFQGLLLCSTCLGAIPILTQTMGFSFELALSMVIINGLLYNLHVLLGDPVVPGWITPAIPLVLGFLEKYSIGVPRIHAVIALQMMVGVIFLIMGVTGWANKLIKWIPDSIKGGILLGAGVAAVIGEIEAGGRFNQFPIAILVGTIVSYWVLFSIKYKYAKKDSNLLYLFGKYGMLPGVLIALIVGAVIGEIPVPNIDWSIFLPKVGLVLEKTSPLGVGFPALSVFLKAIPMALVAYIIAFGDFITSKALVEEADEERTDENIDLNPNRSNIISALRNLIQSVVIPYAPLCGPLWAAVTAAVGERYKEGRKYMDSFFSGAGTFRITTFLSLMLMPIVSFLKPVLPVALSLTLLVQGYVCTRLAMNYVETDAQKGVAGVMGAILATKGAAWGLGVGFIIYYLIGPDKELDKVEESKAA